MDYTYIATGSIRFQGCGKYIFVPYIPTLFSVGDFAYIKADTFKNKINQICIKKVIIGEVIAYQDTLNEMWLEKELTTYDEAVALAKYYYNIFLERLADVDPCAR